jgi:uncharacterized protein (TIGR02453 family)
VRFRGWPAEALDFFERLEADNSKTFWHAHKGEYEHLVRNPMLALLEELGEEFGEAKVFRPNRDIRFSRDKSPYKTNIAATLAKGGYVELSADGLGTGAGYYHLATDQLDRYRSAVAEDHSGADLERLVAELLKSDIEIGGHEMLKTAPKGYAKDHPRVELLRHKGLIAWKHWSPASWLGTAQAKQRVVGVLRASRPLLGWLDTHVGPSTEPAR